MRRRPSAAPMGAPARVLLLAVVLLAGCTSSDLWTKWPASRAIAEFREAGLEAESATAMTPPEYGESPVLPREGLHFYIPSLCVDCGGRAMSFDERADLDAMRGYYVGLGEADARAFSWVFAKDNLLLQINGALPEPTARMYERALWNVS